MYLYNRWKAESVGNIRAARYAAEAEDFQGSTAHRTSPTRRRLPRFLRPTALGGFSTTLLPRGPQAAAQPVAGPFRRAVTTLLTNELNLLLTGGSLAEHLPSQKAEMAALRPPAPADLHANRQIIDSRIRSFLQPRKEAGDEVAIGDLTVLDVLLDPDLREEFVQECENLLLFDSVYDQIIANLDTIAEEAEDQSLSKSLWLS